MTLKKVVQLTVAAILLGALTIQADPFKTFNWTGPDEYENNLPIPAEDILSYNLFCGSVEGGPYDTYAQLLTPQPPSVEDMAALVMNTPGTYYCVATATSLLHNLESVPSNEVNFTVLPGELGLRPKAPVLSIL